MWNALGHETSTTYDAFGRAIQTVDPNGVVRSTLYDGLGRVHAEYVQPVGGTSRQVSETAYQEFSYQGGDPTYAAYSQTTRTTWDVGGVPRERVEYDVVDGFGDVFQTWRPAETTAEWLVQETHRNIAGDVLRTSYPHREDDFDRSSSRPVDTQYADWRQLDGYGRPIESYDTKETSQGNPWGYEFNHTTWSHAAGWTRQYRDGAFEKVVLSDTRGRIAAVWDGRSAILVRSARYRMDARSRVVEFVDADDNVYDYRYDGAGRLREVGRKSFRARTSGLPPGVSSAPDLRTRLMWYRFDYDGPRPSDMYEGRYETPLWVAGWTYDALGRPVAKYVLADRTTGATELYEWEWDTGWIGAIAVQEDPHGTTTYEYDPDLFGAQGFVTAKERTWTDPGAPTARFEYDHDFDGTVVAMRWPSGAEVVSDLSPDTRWLLGHTVDTGAQTVPITYHYGDWGEATGFEAPGAPGTEFALDVTWATPDRVADLDWTTTVDSVPTTRSVSYVYRPWGDIEWKEISDSGHYEYWYGNDGRMTTITQLVSGQSIELERYYYTALGDLTKVRRSDEGQWGYALDAFSQSWKRTHSVTGEQHKATWDHCSRMATWLKVGSPSHLWTFSYDGAGRLTRSLHVSGSPVVTVLDSKYAYDVADQLVWEQAGAAKTWRFEGWRKDASDVIEKLLPMVSLVDGDLRWTFLEADKHALEVFDHEGDSLSFEVLGAYGMPMSGTTAGSWPIDGFHGAEPDRSHDLVHMGARHIHARTALWMQPEPLLYLGPTNGDLANPLFYGGVYAGGNSANVQDRSGYRADRREGPETDPEAKYPAKVTKPGDPTFRYAVNLVGAVFLGGVGLAAVAPEAVATLSAAVLPRMPTISQVGTMVVDAAEPTGVGISVGGGGIAAGGMALDAATETMDTVRALHPDVADPHKIAHVFQEKHQLGGLVEQLGGEQQAMGAIVGAAEARVLEASHNAGAFTAVVDVAGETLEIRGSVVDGVTRVGTAFLAD